MNKEEMNIELRKEILGMSLSIENNINELLLIILQVGKEREKRKALGNKSSSVPLNSKANLLLDLEILETDEYNKIILFSEFRNQFIHNMECSSFAKAIKLLGKDGNNKRNRLLEYAELPKGSTSEEDYIKSYYVLYEKIHDIIKLKIEKYKSEQMRNGNTIYSILKYVSFCKEKEIELLKRIETICEEHKKKNGEKLLSLIKKEIYSELISDARTERWNEYDKVLDNLKYFIPVVPPEMKKDVKPPVTD